MMDKRLSRAAAAVLIGGLSLLGASAAEARSSRGEPQFTPDHAPGTPLLAVVALREQRISIYDAKGKIMESPVSSGQTNYETPAGIYSIVQKEEEHHSNLYDDASMPFMERITWTGMALHAGVLPGYAASHGCVRLPKIFRRAALWRDKSRHARRRGSRGHRPRRSSSAFHVRRDRRREA